jgi:hypothetical protein
MIIQINPMNYPRIFYGFETLFRIYHPDEDVPEVFEFDNIDDHFNLEGIEHKMSFMTAQAVEEFVTDPESISIDSLDHSNLHDADELFDEFFFDEVCMELRKLPGR